ncbi:MAG: aminoacyl-tRNA hydrolase [Lachnospiraceae bacterium]|nr:aminoacyl-tRNA hydrolase [Lachnospiraceae bacterium]
MFIIVGLGNPGNQYAGTRHNIGFSAITYLSDRFQIPLNQNKHKAILGTGYIEGQKVVLAQPQTYMNLSGESVRALADFFKVPSTDIIIIYDDISLDVGQLRIRKKGSAGGHNGIKSIIQHLGTDVFPRIKVGVGQKPEGWDLADHVLARFPKEQDNTVRESLKDTTDACEKIIGDSIEAAMNIYNKKKKS